MDEYEEASSPVEVEVEIAALRSIVDALDTLDAETRQRSLRWVIERYSDRR